MMMSVPNGVGEVKLWIGFGCISWLCAALVVQVVEGTELAQDEDIVI